MSNNTTWVLSDTFYKIQDQFGFVAYYIISPLHFFLAMPGHILLLLTFYHQYKEEREYAYQMFSAVGELLELIFYFAYDLSINIFSNCAIGSCQSWFLRQYWLMWYTSHAAIPFVHMAMMTTFMLSLSMTFDQIYALSNPLKYQNMKHWRHQLAALTIRVLIGVGTSISDMFRFYVEKDGDQYSQVPDMAFLSSPASAFFARLRDFIRIFGCLVLIVSNIYLVALYHRKSKLSANVLSDHQQELRKRSEKTLVTLTVIQSSLTTIRMIAMSSFFIYAYVVTFSISCGGWLFAAAVDATYELRDILEFYLVLAFNAEVRRIVKKILKCVWSTAEVTPVQPCNGH